MNSNINHTFINKGSLNTLVKISWFILPLLIIQIILHFITDNYHLDFYQMIIISIAILFFISLNIFKNIKFVIHKFYQIQSIFLLFLIGFEFLWYATNPTSNQLFSFILGITITGVALLKPKQTIVFYMGVIITLIFVNYFKQYNILQYVNYFFISAICIIGFNFWRDKLFSKIQNSENSYKSLFEDYQALIFIVSQSEYKIIQHNKAAQTFFKNKPIKNKIFTELFTCEYEKKDVIKYLKNLKPNSKQNFLETSCKEDKNEYIPKEFYFRQTTFFNQDVIVITVKLIKERKEKEKQLKESKKSITQVLDNINSFVYNISFQENGDRRVKFVSTKAEEILKIELDELVVRFKSNKNAEFVHPDDLSFVNHQLKKVNNTLKPLTMQYRLLVDDEYRWFEEKIFPKKEKEAFVHFGIVTDITQQKINEIKLVNSEQNYRQLFEESLAGIYKTTEAGQIIEANLAFANILGFESVEELKKHNIKEYYFEEYDRKDYLNKLKKEKSLKNYITVLKRIDGKRVIVSNNVFYVTQNNQSFISGTLIDVTELHETTETLKKNELELIESQKTFKSIVDSSPAALFIFNDNNELVFLNPLGEKLYQSELNNTSKIIDEIFDKNQLRVINNIIREESESIKSYTELKINNKNYVVQVVKVNYNSSSSNLLIFRDNSLEKEYNIQKIRAKIAEETNSKLEQEITRHKSTQKLLIENTKFTENVLDSSLDMIIASDTNRKITVVNSAVLNRLGYTKNELIGKDIDIIYTDINSAKKVFNSINKSEKFIGEVENIDKFKNKFKSFLSATTIKNEEGKVIGYMGVSRDLSEIEEIKKIITDQSSLIESLFKNESNVFIWIINKKMEITSFNESTNNYFKKINNKSLLKNNNFLDQIKESIKPKYLTQTKQIYQNALDGEKTEFEALMYDKKGKKYWIDVHLNPIVLPNGTIEEVVCLGHDITDKKLKTRQIEVSESNIRAVIKAIPDMIFKVSLSGEVVDYEVNSNEQTIILESFAGSKSSLIGKNINEIFNKTPKFLKEIQSLIKKTIKTEKVVTQHFNYKFENTTIYFENRYSKVNENEAIIVVRNQTDEIENEQKLKESIHEKEVLLKEVHHRVKNNLQIINSILNLQSSYVTDEKTLEIINESQNRIRSMSYIHESLYQTNNFSSINFKDYIENLINNLIYSYQVGNNIEVVKEIESIDLELDQAIPCGLILNEIMTNALKYAYLPNESGKIIIKIAEQEKKIKVTVEDFGIGLPKKFNIETSESLGLSLVHTLVDQVDGELIVKSDGGTKFLIIFEKLES